VNRHHATVFLLISFIVGSIHFAEAQQPVSKIRRVGFLGSVSPHASGDRSRVEGLRLGLRQLGYVEGKNILIEYRYADGKIERLPSLAAELVSLKVDILLARGAPAAHAAKNATGTIPIIFGNAADPVGTGLVSSLARLGGNITGLSDFNSGVITKRLELIKEVVPKIFHVAVFLNPANPTNRPQSNEIDAIAPALGVKLLSFEVQGFDDIERAFTAMKKERTGALLVIGGAAGNFGPRIAEIALENRLPTIWTSSNAVETGGLMSYGTDFADLYRRAATYVDKILKGAKPGDLPVEQPTKFELTINLKTAKQIGLTIPPNVLARADRVIK
jgi:putative ABC transport system substrate-binding protein